MNRQQTRERLEEYVAGWTDCDIERFLATLAEDVVVIECDGSTIRGVEDARRWFQTWHAPPFDGRVTRWTIERFLFDEAENSAAVEWSFACSCYGTPATFHGASVVTFSAERIARIHEYRRELLEAPLDEKGHE